MNLLILLYHRKRNDGRSRVIQDKDDLETLKLFKLDLLGLGALNVVHRSFDLIAQHYKQSYSLATVPQRQATYDMICKGDTVGVFQIESRAQMSMLLVCGLGNITIWSSKSVWCDLARSPAEWFILIYGEETAKNP